MRLPPFSTTAVCSLLIALGIGLARPAWAAEIRVLNANALTIALWALAAEHTKQTGIQVTFGSPGQIQQKVDAGENCAKSIAKSRHCRRDVKPLFPGEIFGKAGDNDSVMAYKDQVMMATRDANCHSILPEGYK